MTYKIIRTQKGNEMQHNVIMEAFLRRDLNSYEVVHHIDLDKTNDSLINLYLCKTRGIHSIIHKQFRRLARKLAIELLRLNMITFDKNKEIYVINLDRINLDQEGFKKKLENVKITPGELKKIKKMKKSSLTSVKLREERVIDRSDYDKTRDMEIMKV